MRIVGGRDDLPLVHDSTLSALPPSLEATTFGGTFSPGQIRLNRSPLITDSKKATTSVSGDHICLAYPEHVKLFFASR